MKTTLYRKGEFSRQISCQTKSLNLAYKYDSIISETILNLLSTNELGAESCLAVCLNIPTLQGCSVGTLVYVVSQ